MIFTPQCGHNCDVKYRKKCLCYYCRRCKCTLACSPIWGYCQEVCVQKETCPNSNSELLLVSPEPWEYVFMAVANYTRIMFPDTSWPDTLPTIVTGMASSPPASSQFANNIISIVLQVRLGQSMEGERDWKQSCFSLKFCVILYIWGF